MRAVALVLVAMLFLSTVAGAESPPLPVDRFFVYDRAATCRVHIGRVDPPVRDGSFLACDIHRPAGAAGRPAAGRFPAIVYDFDAYDQLGALGGAARYFVTRGYVAAVCNVRGSGGSPGYLDPFGAQEQRDNYDLIEWLARQPWTNSRVGQMGVSYGVHSSLLVAVNKPPHLVAIIPVDGISDWYENTIYRGGIYSARIRPWQQSTAPGTPDERLVFRTGPLRTDLVLAGGIGATIRATFSAADGNLAVVVSDVAPDGAVTRITQGWLKASHRRGHERPVSVHPNVELAVDVWPTHYRLPAGHRLEVTVASDDYPEIDSDAPAGRVTINRGTVRLTTQ